MSIAVKKKYVDFDRVRGHLNTCIHDMTVNHQWQPDVVVPIVRGGLLPATMLSQYYAVPLMPVSLSFRDFKRLDSSVEDVCAVLRKGFKRILVVEDINDSGATLGAVTDLFHEWSDKLTDAAPVIDVRVLALVDNSASRFRNVDYAGELINKHEEDVWVVFPWEEWWVDKP